MRARSSTRRSAPPAVCAVGYQWRGVEALDALREALAGQQLGLLIGIGTGPTQSRPWFLDRAQGGGNLLERASHIIDLERAVGGEVVAVQAAASRVPLAQSAGGERGDIEDAAALVLRFARRRRRRDPDRVDPRRAAGELLARRARQRLLAASRARPRRSRCSGRSGGARVEAAMRAHPMDRTLERFLEAARAGDRDAVFCTPRRRCGHARGRARLRGGDRRRRHRAVAGARAW